MVIVGSTAPDQRRSATIWRTWMARSRRARLAALPTRQRQTLVLRYFADLSVETTAEIMQCSTGTVKSQTAKGLSALRKQLSMNPTPAQVREQR